MAKKKSTSTTSKKKVAEKSATTSNEELLEYAMGAKPIEEIIQEKYWVSDKPIDKNFILYRREARRTIYKLIKNMKNNIPTTDPKVLEMQELIRPQLDGNLGLNWGNFTSKWDLHPKDVTKIILKEHWIKEGGGFDADLGTHSPTAFTGQNLK